MAQMVYPSARVAFVDGPDGESRHAGELSGVDSPRASFAGAFGCEARFVGFNRLDLEVERDGHVSQRSAAGFDVWELLSDRELVS